ncbi:ABC transporter ATP-binding protein [Flavobacterium sp. J372]|uniref:ABC transporter ATP-binding protein n=1 Tax=Flavobacterium sp. J372 TaxID=2898436 RepID=UPI0021515648|nr:ABC transporter ATP-binding protein [Flavobacterium sp. J372]MCR5861758.1 ABC transporter ATP-binding protein [Flavobacterium sp. J372]
MTDKKIILSAENVSIGYATKKQITAVASGINIDLKEGTLTALIGANGTGKSTLLRTITGIQKPLAGSVTLNGKPLESYSNKTLSQQLSIVLTENLPPSNLTVYELVALGRQPYTNWLGKMSPEDYEHVNNALNLTETNHLANRRNYELSDGQLQKVLIARALAQDTPLIILDEPTTHLDLKHKVSLLQLLKRLAVDSGKSILYSTHDLDLALQVSDEIIVISVDKTVQSTPDNLMENNAFDTLFDGTSITFDKDKKGFIINPDNV